MSWEIRQADCIEAMRELDESSVDAVVCDPPYHLTFMGRSWDHAPSPAESQVQHHAWATEALRILKPGGHLLAFGGTRTYHRLACAVEDAGFEIRDSVIWLYGSGFPKSLDVSKAIDRVGGREGLEAQQMARELIEVSGLSNAEIASRIGVDSRLVQFWRDGEQRIERDKFERLREVVEGLKEHPPEGGREYLGDNPNRRTSRSSIVNVQTEVATLTAPATPEAEQWQGWGTALKPSHEPVVMAQKPVLERDMLAEIGSHLDTLEAWLAQGVAPRIRTGEAGDLSGQTDTSPSGSGAGTFSNIVTSWRACWAELWNATNTSTMSTATRPTTDLRTLCCSLSEITRASTTPDLSKTDGWRSLVEAADGLFAAAVLSSRATRALSAAEPATESTAPNSPVEGERTPSHEPIVVARKPLVGTVAQNVQEHGTGALNVDGCRIGYQGEADKRLETRGVHVGGAYQHPAGDSFKKAENAVAPAHDAGRWPANTVLSHTEDCEQVGTRRVRSGNSNQGVEHGTGDGTTFLPKKESSRHYADEDGMETVTAWKCAPDCPVRMLDEQSGDRKSNGGRVADSGMFAMRAQPEIDTGYGDSGGASRFFYTAKASRSERNAGLEEFEERPLPMGGHGNGEGDPISVEMGSQRKARNSHPTVKPIALMRWLCRLVTPPGGSILDPFAGSGTTGCAAVLEDFDFLGIEREADYVEIAKARLAYWASQPVQLDLEAA